MISYFVLKYDNDCFFLFILSCTWSICSSSWSINWAGDDYGIAIAATVRGETPVCLGVIQVKVRGKRGDRVIETYSAPDNGCEVTLFLFSKEA